MKILTGFAIGAAAVGLTLAGIFVGRAIGPMSNAAPRAGTTGTPAPAQGGSRKILYYRNAMGLPDTSPTPKKDSMGMDYLPVYADEQSSGDTLHISTDKLQKLGVQTAVAEKRRLSKTLRVAGTIQYDERRQYSVSPKFEGWITRLLVSTTGASVRRGQPLLEVYSPDLISAEEDYRVAAKALGELSAGDANARRNMQALMQGSLERLRNWDIAEPELGRLRTDDRPPQTMILRAQHDGVITEKTARVGLRFMPGESLFQIADLSTVWMIGNVFEQDLAAVRVGMPVRATLVSNPGVTFSGKVSFIDPVLQADSRSVQVRIELPNPQGRLKPAMYASVELEAGPGELRLAVPNSAILDSGTRQLVLIDRGGGKFEPRAVHPGARADGYTEILAGVAEHDVVVVNGNFLIDSESNLRSALAGFGEPSPSAATSER